MKNKKKKLEENKFILSTTSHEQTSAETLVVAGPNEHHNCRERKN